MLATVLLPVVVACSTARAGSARVVPGAPEAGSVAVSGRPSPVPAATGPSASSTSSSGASAGAQPVDPSAETLSFAHVRFGPPGVPSPTGEIVAQLDRDRVCFVPVAAADPGAGTCAALAAGDRPQFASFAPDGSSLLVVGRSDEDGNAVYVIDAETAAVRVVGPDGVAAAPPDPPRWDLSSASWSVDGSALVLVPHTGAADGPALSVGLSSGRPTEIGRLTSDLANGRPSVWATRSGVALVNNEGSDRQTLWWLPADATTPTDIGRFEAAGGSLYLAAADPHGTLVLVCPRAAGGRLGPTVAVGTGSGTSARVLTDSASCAGAVFSPDGSRVALAATVGGSYSLIVVRVHTGDRLLTVPLPVAEPATPPYLTWHGDTVVAVDGSGTWSLPSLIVGLH